MSSPLLPVSGLRLGETHSDTYDSALKRKFTCVSERYVDEDHVNHDIIAHARLHEVGYTYLSERCIKYIKQERSVCMSVSFAAFSVTTTNSISRGSVFRN